MSVDRLSSQLMSSWPTRGLELEADAFREAYTTYLGRRARLAVHWRVVCCRWWGMRSTVMHMGISSVQRGCLWRHGMSAMMR